MGRLNALKAISRSGSVLALSLIFVFPYTAYVTAASMSPPALTSGLGSATTSITDITSSNSTSQLYNGTPPSEQVYNTTNPDYSMTGTALDEVNQTEGPITINVLLAGDDEAQNTEYWAGQIYIPPTSPDPIDIYVDWITYSKVQVERGDESLVAKYGVDLRVRGAITWDSDDQLDETYYLNLDMINKTGWDNTFVYDGYEIDVLFGITGQTIDNVASTFSEYKGYDPDFLNYSGYKNTVIAKWAVYWADDNVVQHEMSHILSMTAIIDHQLTNQSGYFDDCIMSYRTQDTWYIYESGYLWLLLGCFPYPTPVYTCVLTHNYCTECNKRILSWKYHDIDGNGKVEVKDLSSAGKAFGSHLGDANWDPRCDVNWDGTVDIKDLSLIARYFGLQIW